MSQNQKAVQRLFGLGIIAVGVLTAVYGYEVLLFLPAPPTWIPWLKVVGYVSTVIMLGTGAGLVFDRTARVSIWILLPFLLLWTLSRVPVVVLDPLREISWFGIGEVAVLAAAAMILYVRLAEPSGGPTIVRIARILFGLSLVTYGLSHFFEFAARTVSLVPAWLPFRTGWADLCGAGQIAAGLGVAFAVYPRVAAAAEAAMLSLFTLLVWVPAIITKPGLDSNWVEGLFTFALACASWLVAESISPTAARSSDRLALPDEPAAGTPLTRQRS